MGLGELPKTTQGHFCLVVKISCASKMFTSINQQMIMGKSAVMLNSRRCSTIVKKAKTFEDIPGPPKKGPAV